MRRLLNAAALVASVVAAMTGTARADAPSAAGCPESFELRTVASFEAAGPYRLPRLVDTAGNGDGLVCALPLPDAARDADCRAGGTIACLLAELGLPLYHFKDNTTPAVA